MYANFYVSTSKGLSLITSFWNFWPHIITGRGVTIYGVIGMIVKTINTGSLNRVVNIKYSCQSIFNMVFIHISFLSLSEKKRGTKIEKKGKKKQPSPGIISSFHFGGLCLKEEMWPSVTKGLY